MLHSLCILCFHSFRLRCLFLRNCFWNSMHILIANAPLEYRFVLRAAILPFFSLDVFFFYFSCCLMCNVYCTASKQKEKRLATKRKSTERNQQSQQRSAQHKCINRGETWNKHLVRDGFSVHINSVHHFRTCHPTWDRNTERRTPNWTEPNLKLIRSACEFGESRFSITISRLKMNQCAITLCFT